MLISSRLPMWMIVLIVVGYSLMVIMQGFKVSTSKSGTPQGAPQGQPIATNTEWATVPVMSHAHSHNDYNRERPLLDALDAGFWSVEADIFLDKGKCVVAHDEEDIDDSRTLVSMYLEPLWERFKENSDQDGMIQSECEEFILLIDLKEGGNKIYDTLAQELRPYREMLTRVKNGKLVVGRVLVCLSGKRPVDRIRRDKNRLFFLDGRTPESNPYLVRTLVPLVSADIKNYLNRDSRRKKTITVDDIDTLKVMSMVENCRKNGQLFRLWGYPDDEDIWALLLTLGVDLINTDDPVGLQAFLQRHWTSMMNDLSSQ